VMVGFFSFSNIFSMLHLRKSVLKALVVYFLPIGISKLSKIKQEIALSQRASSHSLSQYVTLKASKATVYVLA